jgi:hypothetical protein
MKMVISIPVALFESAERFDAIYGMEVGSLDPATARLQAQSLPAVIG